jgi:hypothetical protein
MNKTNPLENKTKFTGLNEIFYSLSLLHRQGGYAGYITEKERRRRNKLRKIATLSRRRNRKP